MKLMKMTTGEHHVLPEEMLAKKKQVFIFSCSSQDAPFSLLFHTPQLVLSQTFYLPKACERYTFRAERRIGHYSKYYPFPRGVHGKLPVSRSVLLL